MTKAKLDKLKALVPEWIHDLTVTYFDVYYLEAILSKYDGAVDKYLRNATEFKKWFKAYCGSWQLNSATMEKIANKAKLLVECDDPRWETVCSEELWPITMEFVLLAIRNGGTIKSVHFRKSKKTQHSRFVEYPICYRFVQTTASLLSATQHSVVIRWWRTLSEADKSTLRDRLGHDSNFCHVTGVPLVGRNCQARIVRSTRYSPDAVYVLCEILADDPNLAYVSSEGIYMDIVEHGLVQVAGSNEWYYQRLLHQHRDGLWYFDPEPDPSEIQRYHSQRRETSDLCAYDLGVENEVKFKSEEDRRSALKIIAGDCGMICEQDGSLCYATGCEIVQRRPKPLLETLEEWRRVMDVIPTQKDTGYGMHINICTEDWGDEQLASFVGFWSINDDFVKYLAKREYGRYCGKAAPLYKEPKDKLSDSYHKYRACCVHSSGRAEVRIFRGTHSFELLAARCQAVDAVARWAGEIECSANAVSLVNGPGLSLLNYMKKDEDRYANAIRAVRTWVKLRTRTGHINEDGVYIEPPPTQPPESIEHEPGFARLRIPRWSDIYGGVAIETPNEEGVYVSLTNDLPSYPPPPRPEPPPPPIGRYTCVRNGQELRCPRPPAIGLYYADADGVVFFSGRSGGIQTAMQFGRPVERNLDLVFDEMIDGEWVVEHDFAGHSIHVWREA